jgi:hypothetical protein
MTSKYVRKGVTAFCLGAGLLLAACVDERPNPQYNYGMAYTPPPCTNCAQSSWYDWHDGQWHVQ